MSDITILRARLRKRDKDIQQAINNLKLDEGQLADMVRDGFRKVLEEKGLLGKSSESLTPDNARRIAQQLVQRTKS